LAPNLEDPVIAQGISQALKPEAVPAVEAFLGKLNTSAVTGDQSLAWTAADIAQEIKCVIGLHNIKMPQLAIPIRWWCFGRGQTPAVDAMLSILPPSIVAERIEAGLDHYRGAGS
ncbi:MAG: hypothetical protein ACO3V7_11940, partial [Burkholderiaceae bacterium]